MAASVYFVHAATTPHDPQVRAAMLPYLDGDYGPPPAGMPPDGWRGRRWRNGSQ